MAFEDISRPDGESAEPLRLVESHGAPKTAWERKIDAARARRQEKLGETARASSALIARDEPPPPGETGFDRVVAAIERRAPEDERPFAALIAELSPRAKTIAPLALAFILGLGLGYHIVAGPRAADTIVAGPVPPQSAISEGVFVSPEVMSTTLDEAVEPGTIAADSVPDIFTLLSNNLSAPEDRTRSGLSLPTVVTSSKSAVAHPTLPDPLAERPPRSTTAGGEGWRVHVTAPASIAAPFLETIPATLAAAGAGKTSVVRVNFAVSQTHVRFYHAEDAAGAAQVAQAVNGEARDFTGFTPKPRPGTLEVYIEGDSGGAARPPAPAIQRAFNTTARIDFGSAIQFLVRSK